jgi:hypothetical protein
MHNLNQAPKLTNTCKTQMSEPQRKTKNQKKNISVVSWWVGVVRLAEATKPREVEIDRPDGGRRHCLVVSRGIGWWQLRCLVGEGEERIWGERKVGGNENLGERNQRTFWFLNLNLNFCFNRLVNLRSFVVNSSN